MAVGNGVGGGERGDLELNSLANPDGGSQDPGGVPESNSPSNPSGGSDRQGLGGVPESSSPPNLSGGSPSPSGGSPPPGPQNVVVEVSENVAHQEILNVLWIEGHPEHAATLKEWDRKEKYLSSKVDRKEKRSADLTNHIFNIVGFFSVFQGVVLTAVSQLKSSNNPLCGMVWVPALLSILAAVVAIIAVWIKFSTLQELEVSIFSDKIAQREVAGRVTRLRGEGRNFSFRRHAAQGGIKKSSSWVSVSRIWVILSLVIFTGLIILSYVVILCNSLAVSKWNKHLLSST